MEALNIFVDAHVHFYDCFTFDAFFSHAFRNFRAAAKQYGRKGASSRFFLLLSENQGRCWFDETMKELENASQPLNFSQLFSLHESGDSIAFIVRERGGDDEIVVVAGRQIVTGEKLEVLSLFHRGPISDGLSLRATIAYIDETGGVAVIPWGAGKWFGKRGKALKEILEVGLNQPFLLGDNGGRPGFWPTPTLLYKGKSLGYRNLSGSDPLPLPGEVRRPGSFGSFCCIEDSFSKKEHPAQACRELLQDGATTWRPYGALLPAVSFVKNQLQIRL